MWADWLPQLVDEHEAPIITPGVFRRHANGCKHNGRCLVPVLGLYHQFCRICRY